MCGRAAAYLCYMELSYSAIKKLQVVCLGDGKNLGRVCDVVLTYPEGRVQGIVAPGGKGFRWGKAELFIELRCVKKIGIDVVLVEVRSAPKPEKRGKWGSGSRECAPSAQCAPNDRRDYGEYE